MQRQQEQAKAKSAAALAVRRELEGRLEAARLSHADALRQLKEDHAQQKRALQVSTMQTAHDSPFIFLLYLQLFTAGSVSDTYDTSADC